MSQLQVQVSTRDQKKNQKASPSVNEEVKSHKKKYQLRHRSHPRLIAGVVMLPFLVLVADVIGVLGGYLVGVYSLGFTGESYLRQTWDFVEYMDVMSGLVKAAVFGLIVTLMGCYHGYHSGRGAQGVGAATTNAVVTSSILILVFNYIITQVFFS